MGFDEMFKAMPIWLQELITSGVSGFVIGFSASITNNTALGSTYDQLKVGLMGAVTLGTYSALRSIIAYVVTKTTKSTAAGALPVRQKILF